MAVRLPQLVPKGVRLVVAAAALLVAVQAVQAQVPPFISRPVIVNPAPPAPILYTPTLQQAATRPEYAFAYGVQDPTSGNAQSHQEERDGDRVRGQYKVLEADGSVRTVTYTVDPKNGFQANVRQSDPSLAAAYKAQPQPSILSPVIVSDASDVDSDHDHEDATDYFSAGLEDYDHDR